MGDTVARGARGDNRDDGRPAVGAPIHSGRADRGLTRRGAGRFVFPTRFDSRFDHALLTRPGTLGHSPEVRLEYPSADAERRHRVEDALAVALLLEASDVVLVTPTASGLRFDRVTVSAGSVRASVIVDAATFASATVLRAATALLENRSVDLSGPEPVVIAPGLRASLRWRARAPTKAAPVTMHR